jgi:2-dehydro-3-deoxygluconokinase
LYHDSQLPPATPPRKPRVVAIGECMVELSRTVLGGRSWAVGHGGDSYNVAAYMHRLGLDTAYVTALGRDSFSDELREAFAEEGIDTTHVLTHPTRNVGMYAIRVDEGGERSFTYWRSDSAARALFECEGASEAISAAREADLLYVSAITLSLFGSAGRMQLGTLAASVRRNGGRVAFDTNYRVAGWPDVETARRTIAEFGRHVDIVLPTLADDSLLFGDRDAEACARRWHDAGATEVVVKLGEKGALLSADRKTTMQPPILSGPVRDTTGAGDSLNAAYLAARLYGIPPEQAIVRGVTLAGAVIGQPGAIIPRYQMPLRLLAETHG